MICRTVQCCVQSALFLAAGAACAQSCAPVWSDQFETTDFSTYVGPMRFFDDGSGPALFVSFQGARSANGETLRGLAKWNGRQWSAVGGPVVLGSSDAGIMQLLPFPDGSGTSLFVTGYFDSAGGVPVAGTAKWNGTAWSAMDAGYFAGGGVEAAVVMDRGTGPQLYASGPRPSGFGDHGIARWTGSAWAVIGTVASSTTFPGTARVRALAAYNAGSGVQLYAGGTFGFVNGILINGVARWNGSSWSSAGAVGGSYITCMAVHDDGSGPALYAGGLFNSIGGVASPGVARYNGTTWSRVGLELASGTEIYTLRSVDLDGAAGNPPVLYASGRIIAAGTLSDARIAMWNGTNWLPLGSGVATVITQAPDVYAVEPATLGGRTLAYVGGYFHRAGGLNAYYMAGWDGAAWTPINQAVSGGQVLAAASFQDRTYICGAFNTAGQRPVTNLARWSPSGWEPFGALAQPTTFPLGANDLQVFDDGTGEALYVAGNFGQAGPVPARAVARWDGTTWTAAEAGTSFITVYDLAVMPDSGTPRLFALGRWTGNTTTQSQLAKLIGGAWVPVGPTLPFIGNAAAHFDGPSGPTYYAGGFVSAIAALRRLDGGTWTTIPASGGTVSRLLVYDDGGGPGLLAAGRLSNVGGVAVSNVARLRQGTWGAMGTLTDTTISSLALHDDGSGPALYAGGVYAPAAGGTQQRVLRQTGQTWNIEAAFIPAPSGGTISALTSAWHNNRPALVAGGQFTTVNGLGASSVAILVGCNPPCYANCDLSTAPPVLNVNDFLCFLNRFAAAESFANCDGSTTEPVLNVLDFTCFLNQFAGGCP